MTWILPKQLHTLASALDTEALSLDLGEQSEICGRSLFVRSKPSQSQIWLRKWKRDSWTQHLSGRILRPFLGQRFVTEWISSLGATHASPSAQQDSAKASKTRGTSGRGLQMVFDFSDPGAASLKTSKDISAWGCPTSSKTWQEWVTEQRGDYSARLKSARLTSGSGSSSWPTVTANEDSYRIGGESQQSKCLSAMARRGEMSWLTPNAAESLQGGTTQGQRKSPNLSIAAHGPAAPASSSIGGSRQESSQVGWRTPTCFDWKNHDCSTQVYLADQVEGRTEKQWQTATVSTGAHRQKDGSMIDKLDQQVKQWQTPKSNDSESGKKISGAPNLLGQARQWATPRTEHDSGMHRGQPDTLHSQMKQTSAGKLNPRWVETLMGLPVGWTMPSCTSPVTIAPTNFASSETGLYQPPQSVPSEF